MAKKEPFVVDIQKKNTKYLLIGLTTSEYLWSYTRIRCLLSALVSKKLVLKN